jgi:hypothetical protein
MSHRICISLAHNGGLFKRYTAYIQFFFVFRKAELEYYMYVYVSREQTNCSRVSWVNSDQNFKISFCFYSLSFISRCEEVILGPEFSWLRVIFLNWRKKMSAKQNRGERDKTDRVSSRSFFFYYVLCAKVFKAIEMMIAFLRLPHNLVKMA